MESGIQVKISSPYSSSPNLNALPIRAILPFLPSFLSSQISKVSGKTPSKDGNALVLRSGINRWFPAKVGYNCFRLLQATLVALWNEKFSLPLFREIIASPIL